MGSKLTCIPCSGSHTSGQLAFCVAQSWSVQPGVIELLHPGDVGVLLELYSIWIQRSLPPPPVVVVAPVVVVVPTVAPPPLPPAPPLPLLLGPPPVPPTEEPPTEEPA